MVMETDAAVIDAWQVVCADLDNYGWACGAESGRVWAAPAAEWCVKDARCYFGSVAELVAFASGFEMGAEWPWAPAEAPEPEQAEPLDGLPVPAAILDE